MFNLLGWYWDMYDLVDMVFFGIFGVNDWILLLYVVSVLEDWEMGWVNFGLFVVLGVYL